MALKCDVVTSDGITVANAYIRPKFECRTKITEDDVSIKYLFVECEVYVSEILANTFGSRQLQVSDVDRFKGLWIVDGGTLEAQGYVLMKTQEALLNAVDV